MDADTPQTGVNIPRLFTIRRQIRDAEREITFATRRVDEIGLDLEQLVSTEGDAFAMTVGGQRHRMRKDAGRALLKTLLALLQRQHEGRRELAHVGGFPLRFEGSRLSAGEYRYTTKLVRTGLDQEIDLPVTMTPLGVVARIEHALAGFATERAGFRKRLDEARRQFSSYRSREGGAFAFAGELVAKRRELLELDAALAAAGIDGDPRLAA